MKERVYVIGHKRPDTDSISASISYSYLKNKIDPSKDYLPRRLGDLNPETSFVLEYFGLSAPETIDHVYITVEDAMAKKVITARCDQTIYDVGNLMEKYSIRSVPVVDKSKRFIGMVTERTLARHFLGEFLSKLIEENPPKLKDVARIMEGEIVCGSPDDILAGRLAIGAMSIELIDRMLKKNDILIVGDRTDVQILGIRKGIRALIITGGITPEDNVVDLARKNNVILLLTPHDTYAVSRLLRLSLPATTAMVKKPMIARPWTLLNEFKEDLMESKDGVAVVLDKDSKVVGIITRHDLISPGRKKVILVDHSEKSISVDGIEEAEILEIIDHHRLGGLETAHPLRVIISPVGSTSTVIWEEAKNLDVKFPKEILGLILSAILSDTLLLRSPTTTIFDKKAVDEISKSIGINPEKFGLEMFRNKIDFKTSTIEDIVTMDVKEFHTQKGTVAVAQIEAIEPNVLLSKKDEIKKAMKKVAEGNGYILFIFMITDIRAESSYIMGVGETRLLEKIFGKSKEDILFLEGVVSRKKQVVPRILEAI